jgi:hypothetical protein
VCKDKVIAQVKKYHTVEQYRDTNVKLHAFLTMALDEIE